MSELRQDFLAAARSLAGKPFKHHYEPENLCGHGAETLDSCMGSGMDSRGYDCSGFVIAAMCLVRGINPADWPRGYRHLAQLETQLAKDGRVQPGDIVLTDRLKYFGATHMGLVIQLGYMLHANNVDHMVSRGRYRVASDGTIGHITPEELASVPDLATTGK